MFVKAGCERLWNLKREIDLILRDGVLSQALSLYEDMRGFETLREWMNAREMIESPDCEKCVEMKLVVLERFLSSWNRSRLIALMEDVAEALIEIKHGETDD